MAHDVLTVSRVDGRYVGRCDCGWATPPATTGGAIGEAWDRHRDGAVAGAPQVQVH